ncbi:MAG TPA: TIR domain-containing protein [Ktedonobacterales bacterium]
MSTLPSIFISYSREDSVFVDQLEENLAQQGFVTWLDRQRLIPGRDWAAEIETQIKQLDMVVVVLSPSAVKSEWVNREIAFAQQIKKTIIPIRLKQVDIPLRLSNLHCIDFFSDFGFVATQLRVAWNRILSDPTATDSQLLLPANTVSGEWAQSANNSSIPRRMAVAERKLPNPAKLFYAIKQLRNQYGQEFSFEKLPAKLMLTLRDYSDESDATGQTIAELFQNHLNLLVLGRPGSGKTTLLQQLTLELMDEELRAVESTEEARWLPVFVPLYDWARKKKPLNEWLAEHLSQKLSLRGIDKPLIRYWLSQGNLILLLDGLDEMNREDSKKCIEAINKFGKETTDPLVISCELKRYESLQGEQHNLNFGQSTVVVQYPQPAQVLDYFKQVGATELSQDYQEEYRQEHGNLAYTPLMLYLMTQTIQDATSAGKSLASISEQELMERYVTHTIELHSSESRRNHASTQHYMKFWLTRLAICMRDRPYFYFRPDLLPDIWAKSLYVCSTWAIVLFLASAACFLVATGRYPLWQLLPLLALIAGLYGVLQLLPMVTLIPGIYGFLLKSIATGLGLAVIDILTVTFPFFPFASSKGKTWLHKLGEVLLTELVILSPVLLWIVLKLLWPQLLGLAFWLGLLVVWLVEGLLCYMFYRLKLLERLLNHMKRSSVLYSFLSLAN